jgi:hypothetical protein
MEQSSEPAAVASKKDVPKEETIDLSHKPLPEREDSEPEKNTASAIDTNAFRQFTDEELEKFVTFSRPEKTDVTDLKVEYLHTCIEELKNMVKDLRRAEKDPLIADLMLRTINAKIDYYALSKNVEDYNHIIRLMKDVQKEIEECATQNTVNLAEEILSDLKLQGMAMKKS